MTSSARSWAAWRRRWVLMRACGGSSEWSDELPGYRRFCTFDPHGNRLEFLAPR
ncbi:hypothetical protein [Dactylosporangium sp. NPDC051484]|uniref:hypothetical protein n=1 Tax=Dactylosporangium sp. NPDC051484 TaxID=3154942 RepID=UPI00344C5D8B